MKIPVCFRYLLAVLSGFALLHGNSAAQPFKHPGINQSAEDLAFVKKMVQEGRQPWLDAFQRMQREIAEPIGPPAAHVKRGAYGRPNIGGEALMKSADRAHRLALAWYITGRKPYAEQAIDLIMKWSSVLQDLDYNDAKLLAAWTGYRWCNAAEILRYTYPHWNETHTDRFSRMLMTVYYPLLRLYYPQANGNWDGALIHTLMAIGIFTDERPIFENAVNRFLYGPVNGGLFKYIYPSGQCQESMRDQGHVQLGLGEFAGAAHIAYTQGVDLFSVADHRLALGFEYTARFLTGDTPHCYGPISHRAMKIRDDYEFAYNHYKASGVQMPFTERMLDSTRLTASLSVLTATRQPRSMPAGAPVTVSAGPIGYVAGALDHATYDPGEDAIRVAPGGSLQEALDKATRTGAWVIAEKGVHKLPAALVIPSNVTLAGEGLETVLFLDPKSGARDALVNTNESLQQVTIRDLVIEGATETEIHSDPNSRRSFRNMWNRGGILFQTSVPGKIKNIRLERITVRNCTYNGVFLNGISGLQIIACDFNENGSIVAPGLRLLHNLLLTWCSEVQVADCRLGTSPHGSGVAVAHSSDVIVRRSEIARNGWYGVLITESSGVTLEGNLIEGNDRSGVMAEYLWEGSRDIALRDNLIHYNNGYGVESWAAMNIRADNNVLTGNGTEREQQKISAEKRRITE